MGVPEITCPRTQTSTQLNSHHLRQRSRPRGAGPPGGFGVYCTYFIGDPSVMAGPSSA